MNNVSNQISIKILFTALFLILICSSSNSNSKFNFIIGLDNKYIYHYVFQSTSPPYNVNTIIVASFTKDTIIMGKKYYRGINYPYVNNSWIRWDSVTGSIYRYDASGSCSIYNHERLIDSLFAKLGDCVRECPGSVCDACTDTSYLNIFSYLRKRKSFYFAAGHGGTSTSTTKILLDTIGFYSYNYFATSGFSYTQVTYTLNGCVIKGKVYGDTTVPVGIQQISEISHKFLLSQNYPNPFNPLTKIKYDIPPSKGARGMMTRLIIYDILGREIETLVNESQKPGSYEVTWDGSRFANGVYFYRLITDDFVETKKMVLIK